MMRTDEIVPRVALPEAGTVQRRKWMILSPAFGGLLCAFVAGISAESASRAYQAGVRFDLWSHAISATVFLALAVNTVLRGLRNPQ